MSGKPVWNLALPFLALIVLNSTAAEEILHVDTRSLYTALIDQNTASSKDISENVRVKFQSYLNGLVCDHEHRNFATSLINGQVSINDSRTGKNLSKFQVYAGPGRIAWFSDNGRVLATTAYNDSPRFWSVMTGDELFSSSYTRHAYPVRYGDRTLIIAGSEISILDLKTGRLQLSHLDFGGVYLQGISDMTNKKLYLLSYNALYVFDISDQDNNINLSRRRIIKMTGLSTQINWLYLRDDGRSLFIASQYGNIFQVDTVSFTITPLFKGRLTSMKSFDMNKDGDFLMAGIPATKDNYISRARANDVVLKGNLRDEITHYFQLYTNYGAYACWRSTSGDDAIVGTITNIVNTPISQAYHP